MPALSSLPSPSPLPVPLWDASATATLLARNVSEAASNSTVKHLQVVCAWPVSGQYGPGSRVLYYVLIAACVFARKTDWLRNACLAGALLFPAVAALHGIVLAAVHVNNAVDMDVFGAFQLCSIGILAAPVVVRRSRTYFNDPGRNIIFVWTVLILVGLLSLTVEFFRINTSSCPTDNFGVPISPDPNQFGFNTNCSLTCSTDQGPISPIRGGSANNIYVIPAPSKLTFDTVTLMAAGCCVPAILSLISMWNKILKINWKRTFGAERQPQDGNAVIEGTNGATDEKMKNVNGMIRLFLSAVEIPVFGAAIFAILLCGERNFFSHQVIYQTEPIASIGQWAPIVGTGLAVVGSLYLLGRGGKRKGEDEGQCQCTGCHESKHHRTPLDHEDGTESLPPSSHSLDSADAITPMRTTTTRTFTTRGEELANKISRTATRSSRHPDHGKRRQVAKVMTSIGNYIGTAARDRFDDTAFKTGEALDFPEVPGESNRNPKLSQIRSTYNTRPPSFNGSIRSGIEGRTSSAAPSARGASPSPLRRIDTGATRPEQSLERQHSPVSTPTDAARGRPPRRRATLEVPSAVHYGHGRNNLSISSVGSHTSDPGDQGSPTIIISSDSMIPPPPVHSPTSNPSSPLAQAHPSTPPPT